MKAVIVFDVDSDFDFDQKLWVQIEEYLDGEILESGCHAVKPLPHKKMPKQGEAFPQDMRLIDRWIGWDACIDEIIGETE